MRKFFILAAATGLGSGLLPWIPGTWGTMMAAAVYVLFFVYFSGPAWVLILSTVLISALGIWIAGEAEKYFQKQDPGQVVIDEIAGYGITVMFFYPSLRIAILGFVFFRVFDILKPFPVCKLEKLPRGWGVMLDDIGAGLYAAFALGIVHTVELIF